MITNAKDEHLKAINDIYNQAVANGLKTAHLEPITLEERRSWFQDHPQQLFPIFIYEKDHNVLGWLSISPYRPERQALDEVVEVSFYVDYKHHRKGIASRLMKKAIDFCKQANYRIVLAFLISNNKPSLKLLQKFDFQEAGRIPEAIHYENEFHDHLFMCKNLY